MPQARLSIPPRLFHHSVIDACVLANQPVADVLLSLAEVGEPPYWPHWSETILAETCRTHRKLGWEERLARSFGDALREHFATALVQGYEQWLPHCRNDEKDRHVLACAIEAGARSIITYNLRDFRKEHLDLWGIRALHPQHYLLELYAQSPDQVKDYFEVIAAEEGISIRKQLAALAPHAPEFARALLGEL